MSKLLNNSHRDKSTKEITAFIAIFQIAKNFEQSEKANEAAIQETKGPS